MPTISIRQHGISASRNQQLVNPETGEIMKLAAFNQPERTATKGWTVNVARRNEQRLQQVDFDAIEGVPAFVTLTMPSGQMSEVSAAEFHGWLKRWLQFMKRHGLRHYYWILEFQASGNPHLHVLAWLDRDWDALEQFKALRSWVGILKQIRRGRSSARPDLGAHRCRRRDYRGWRDGARSPRTGFDVPRKACREGCCPLSTADSQHAGRLAVSQWPRLGSR